MNPDIAKIYQDFFPDDIVIVGDAHAYLLEHYSEFDFIWASPPCPSHSDIRRMGADTGQYDPIYPDMQLYEEIIFLQTFCKCKFVIENVKSYYDPLIRPAEIMRHYFWANFHISPIDMGSGKIKEGKIKEWEAALGFDLSKNVNLDKRKVLRNCVNPSLGLHILNESKIDIQPELFGR